MNYVYGTIHGVLTFTDTSVDILIIINDEKGNGHFASFIQYIEHEAKNNNLSIRFIDFLEDRFQQHLEKRGYQMTITDLGEPCAVSFF
jgi:hypothetical protein